MLTAWYSYAVHVVDDGLPRPSARAGGRPLTKLLRLFVHSEGGVMSVAVNFPADFISDPLVDTLQLLGGGAVNIEHSPVDQFIGLSVRIDARVALLRLGQQRLSIASRRLVRNAAPRCNPRPPPS